MKIQSKELLKALKLVRPAVDDKPVIPVLNNVKITEDSVTGTNLNLTITAKINGTGGINTLFPITELINICQVVDGEIELEPGLVKAKKDKFKLGQPDDVNNFPKADPIAGKTYQVSDELIKALANGSKCTMAEGFDYLTTVNLNMNGNLKVYGTDSHTLYRYAIEAEGEPFNIQVPVPFIKSIAPLTGEYTLTVNERRIQFANDEVTMSGTLADGKFPNAEVYFTGRGTDITLPIGDLEAALRKVCVYNTLVPSCIMTFSDQNRVTFCIVDNELNREIVTDIEVMHRIDIESICVNAKNLLRLLSLSDATDVTLNIEGETKPILLTFADAVEKMIIMPLANPKKQ